MNTKTHTEPEMNTTGVQSVEIQTDTILTETKADKIQSKTGKIQTVEDEQKLPEMNTKTISEPEVQTKKFKTVEIQTTDVSEIQEKVKIQTNESELQMLSMNEDITIQPNQRTLLTLKANTSTKVNNTDWIEIKPVNKNLFIMSEQPLKLKFVLVYLNTTVEVFNASSSNCIIKKNQVFGYISTKKVFFKIEENKVMKLTFPDDTTSTFTPSICHPRSENSWILRPTVNLDPKCISLKL